MYTTDWEQTAVESEIELSTAYGGRPQTYTNFTHVHNPYVAWSGDFNRAVGVSLTDFRSFRRTVAEVEQIHAEKGLDRPNRYDLYPPALDEGLWRDYLLQWSYSLRRAIFYVATATDEGLGSDVALRTPSGDEYLDWWGARERSCTYYDEQWYRQVLPLQQRFVRVFRPYWLMRRDGILGWVCGANLGRYLYLFDVGIGPEHRGYGWGRALLQAMRAEAGRQGAQHVLVQSGERLRPFYESCGFSECSSNSVVWLTSSASA
jgi:GNAT superfamily N-acetyltransferase